MSTTTLDPTVASKLQRFGQRRFRMLVARGVCAAVVTFLLCIAVVAFIDWYWVLTDTARWSLSGAAYLITALVVWGTSIRKLMNAPAREELAAHVEDAEPELRENLLSAVELATDNPAAVTDSPVFRGLLQGKVAKQMAKIQVPNLLPLRLLAKWLLAAFAIVVALAALMSLPDPRFRTLAARAILPGANIDRVSRIHVEVLQPTPSSITIAKDETVAVVVEVSGGDVSEVILETFTAADSQRQSMRARTDAEFAANIHVADDSVEYRILAGDAVTRRHTIVAKGRPQVLAFHKTFQFPEYAGLPKKITTEPTGDLIALQGTQAELQLELDQQVSQAELRIDSPDSEEAVVVELKRNEESRWCASVPVEESAIFKVHLVSTETGFENIFSPRYEIRPLPDLIPRAGFLDQTETNLLLPPNDIIALKGMAEDDLPLEGLAQEISVNGREWIEVPLETTAVPIVDEGPADESTDPASANRITSSWNWDLLDLKLKTGDQITTRLVATDRKGNRGESVPIRIVVSAPDFDPDRHQQTEVKAALFDSLNDLATVAAEHKATALEIIKRLRDERGKNGGSQRSSEEQALDRTSLSEIAGKLRQAAANVLTEVQDVTREMPPGADAYDLELVGRMVARLLHEYSHTPDALLKTMQSTDDEKLIRRDLDQLKQTFDRWADDAKRAAFHYQNLISHDLGAAVAEDMDALLRQQQLVVNSPTQTWERLVRQETVVLNQLVVVDRLLNEQRPRLTGHLQNQFRSLSDWTRQRTEQLETTFESEDKLAELKNLSQQLLRELTDRQRMDVIDGGLAERLNQARREFDYRSGTLSEPLTLTGLATREENQLKSQAAAADDSTKSTELTRQAERYVAEVDLKYRPTLDQLRSRRALVQARSDADPQFAADAGLTQRAVTSLLNQHRQGDPAESIVSAAFQEIAPAYRILEAGYDLKNVQLALANLIQLERWGSQALPAKTDHPRQWDVVNKGLEQAVNKLRAAKVNHEIMGRLDQVRWSPPSQDAGRKISKRRWERDDFVNAASNLIEMRDQMQPVGYEIEAVMEDARAIIAKYAPTIPEMAQQAANQLRELEDATTDAADAAERPFDQQPEPDAEPASASEDAPQLAELRQQQERINQQLDDLVEALIEDANSQDVLEEEQRERARDADDSIAMIQDPAQQMNEALQEAEQATDTEQQAQELSKAAEQQERTAQALETVAEHFDRLEQGQDVAETREELRQQERELGLARQMDQRFANAEQLAEMSQQNPDDLLQELEAELAQNPAMREALSEISQNAVQEARNALQDAAKQEQELQRTNERSDQQLLQKKRELASDLRELGNEAARLSQQLLSQARNAASQAKTPEAQQKFEQTQQQLNEAANAARSASESELQQDLAARAQQAQHAIQQAQETLAEAKKQSADAKGEDIHPDDKNRAKAKKNLEDQRKRFNDQRKKQAESDLRRKESDERRANANAQNAERNQKNIERQLKQAEKNSKQKPDDRGRQNSVQRLKQQAKQAQQKVDQAEQQKQNARNEKNEARDERNRMNSTPQPALNDKNPAAQLAESFAEEATQTAKELSERAEQLAQNANSAEDALPSDHQLEWTAGQQERLAENVQETSATVARAARHERRLESTNAAKALQQAAENIEEVADEEVTTAQEKLAAAADAAKLANESGGATPQRAERANAASDALATAEQALAEQADALSTVLEPLQAAEAAATAGEATGEQQGQQSSGEPQAVQPAGNPETASPGSSSASPPQSFTPEEMGEGRQLAQTLDELDRQQAAAAAQAQQQPSAKQPGQATPTPLSNLAQAARMQQTQMASARIQAQQQDSLSSNPSNQPSDGEPAYDGQTDAFAVLPVNRSEDEDWGKLRDQAAEDLTRGRREKVSEEYRKSVETYFRVLAERARRKK